MGEVQMGGEQMNPGGVRRRRTATVIVVLPDRVPLSTRASIGVVFCASPTISLLDSVSAALSTENQDRRVRSIFIFRRPKTFSVEITSTSRACMERAIESDIMRTAFSL